MTRYRFTSKFAGVIIEYEAVSLEVAIRHLQEVGCFEDYPDLQLMPPKDVKA